MPSNRSGSNRRSTHRWGRRSSGGGYGRMKILFVPKLSNSDSTFCLSPVRAAMTAVTDATPMTMPIVVRIARTLLAQIWPSARNALCQARLKRARGRRKTNMVVRGQSLEFRVQGQNLEVDGRGLGANRPGHPQFSVFHPRFVSLGLYRRFTRRRRAGVLLGG